MPKAAAMTSAGRLSGLAIGGMIAGMTGVRTGRTRKGWRVALACVAAVMVAVVGTRVNRSVGVVPSSVELRAGGGVAPAEARLAKALPRVKFERTPLADAIDFLSLAIGADLRVMWRDLEAAGINKDHPVTIDLDDVIATDALRAVLAEAGGGNIALRFRCAGEVVRISTAEAMAGDVVVRVYEVGDLVTPGGAVSKLEAPPGFGLTEWVYAPPSRRPTGTGGLSDQLVSVVEETIAPTSWRSAGGTVGWAGVFGDQLLVVQGVDAHERIDLLLGQVRAEVGR